MVWRGVEEGCRTVNGRRVQVFDMCKGASVASKQERHFFWYQRILRSSLERFRSEWQSKRGAKMHLLTTLHDRENHGNTVGFIAFWLCRCIASGSRCGVNGLCECKVPCEPNACFSKAKLVFLKSQPASTRVQVDRE